MKIVHVILSKGWAGSERSTVESANAQSAKHDVTVIVKRSHRKKGLSLVDQLNEQVALITVPDRLFTQRAIKKALLALQPDIVHCHLRRATRIIAKLKIGIPAVSTLHININGPHFLKMDGIICNARWHLEEIPETFKGHVLKANNSVTPHRRIPEDERLKLRADLGVSKEQFLIGGVGRYHEKKGWHTLIEASKQIDDSSLRLFIFGEGKEEQNLKELASKDDRIFIAGFRRDIKDLYQAFDLLVCPSLFEPLPRVILEGMDAGTPVVASDIGGCKELIDDYGGYIFQAGSGASLAKVLKSCLESRPERHRPDLSEHHIAKANARMEDFYHAVIDAKNIVS